MIKSLQKDDVSAIPFVISKRWHASSKSNQNFLIGDVDYEYAFYSSSFISESFSGSFVSESYWTSTSSFTTELDTLVSVSSSTLPIALEFIDYGDGWIIGCTSSLISDSLYEVLVESASLDKITIESSVDPWFLESFAELSSSRDPYNGPSRRFLLTVDSPLTSSQCVLCLEQSDDNFLTFEDGIRVDNFIKFNPDTEVQNLNDTYKRITYDQIKNLFYNDSRDPTKLLGLENFDLMLDGKNRILHDLLKVVTIPQAYFGDKIVENSVEIVEDSSDQTYTIVDDGSGNLYSRDKIFSVIVKDNNRDILQYNSSSTVKIGPDSNFILNEFTNSISWQYYKNNVLFVERSEIYDFFVYGYDFSNVIHPITYQSNIVYFGYSGSNTNTISIPHSSLLGNFRKIECGDDFVVALKSNGTVVTWGDNSITSMLPTFDVDVTDISVGHKHVIALDNAGKIYVWGDATYTGSLPTVNNSYTKIFAGPSSSVVVHSNGHIYGFGHPSSSVFHSLIPQVSDVKKISIGKNHGMILDNSGVLRSWGVNCPFSQSIIPVESTSSIDDVSCGYDNTISRTTSGSVVSWGKNLYSQSIVPFGTSLISTWANGVWSGPLIGAIPSLGVAPGGPPYTMAVGYTPDVGYIFRLESSSLADSNVWGIAEPPAVGDGIVHNNIYVMSYVPSFRLNVTKAAIATKGLADVKNVFAKADRSGVSHLTPASGSSQYSGYYMTWGQHPFLSTYELRNFSLGKDFVILDPNCSYQKLTYFFPYNSPRELYGTNVSHISFPFKINISNTNEYNSADYKVKISKLQRENVGLPIFSGQGSTVVKDTHKELYSYIATDVSGNPSASLNSNSISIGIKSFYLDTGSANLEDPSFGSYIGSTAYISTLASYIPMGQTGGRDYLNSMTGKFVSYDKYTKELKIEVEDIIGNGTYSKWAIDFDTIVVPELITELNLYKTNDRFYVSSNVYVTSSNHGEMISDENFIDHYLINSGDWNQF